MRILYIETKKSKCNYYSDIIKYLSYVNEVEIVYLNITINI